MKMLRNLSIRKKLIAIILIATSTVMTIGFSVIIYNDINDFKLDVSNNSVINARLVGDESVSPLAFSDPEGAREILQRFNAIPSVINARIYDHNDNIFASYDRDEQLPLPQTPLVKTALVEYEGKWLHVHQPITYRDELYGYIYLRVSTQALDKKINTYLLTIFYIMLGLIAFSYYLASRLQHIISGPIIKLTEATRKIAQDDNYTFRAEKQSNDEIGVLYDDFNNMIDKISQRKQERDKALRELFEEKERAQVTLESIGDAVITTDIHGKIDYINAVAENLTGWSHEEAAGQQVEHVFRIINEITREKSVNPVERCINEGRIVELANHTVLICKDGSEIAIEDSAAPIRNQAGELIGVVMVFHDVTESRKLSQQLIYQARHDALTGLINRREFEERLEHAIEQARVNHYDHALLYMDLDQFKVVNDTCGHAAGDELLRQITSLLQSQMRKHDTLARLGGDEFAVLLEYCGSDEANNVAESLCEAVESYRFTWEGNSFVVGVSIGLVPINKNSGSLGVVMSIADSACYAAKEAGRNRIHSYVEDDTTVAQRHGEMRWVSRITQGLEENNFTLYRQDILSIGKHTTDGDHYEVLIRMKDGEGALAMPNSFLPAAERYNLMPKLDRWVIRTIFEWLSNATDELEALAMCSINLSGHSVGDDKFLQYTINLFEKYNIPPGKICFEITETATIVNLTSATRFIRALKKKGCRFALDDFGSGMSSFLYLKNLPVDFLKIDGGFVKDITHDPMDLALVRSINDIGHVVGMKTIAEFVESEDVLRKLKVLGVDYAQGYHFGQPRELIR
ncbi:MAG TPA: EAL domain-containing protein [Chromatiales bacterium]|nr:EAL domain-containing protein [Chromatiales bacterium]